jgi:hypothetical protein
VAIAQSVAVVAAYAVTFVVVRALASDLVTAATWLVAAGMAAGLVARRLVVARMATVAPLKTWSDRAAARAAAAAAAAAGLLPSRRDVAGGAT